MCVAVLCKQPSLPLKLLDIFPKILPRCVNAEVFIFIFRYNPYKRLNLIQIAKLLKPQELCPIHIRCNIVHSYTDFHSGIFHIFLHAPKPDYRFALYQSIASAMPCSKSNSGSYPKSSRALEMSALECLMSPARSGPKFGSTSLPSALQRS